MLNGYKVYDADAHVMLSPKMWEGLPEEYIARRPRPVRVSDEEGLRGWSTGWLMEGKLEPHGFGPGTQPANTPRTVLKEFGAGADGGPSIGSLDLSDPQARLQDMDRMGIDAQVLFPTTLYAHMTDDPGFEAALFRAYNRYMARQCRLAAGRLKWAALLPLRDARQGCEALAEMVELGARAAVVYGTVGDQLLTHPAFTPMWDELYRTGLPLCVHMGMSYPPLGALSETFLDANVIAMGLPAQLAFAAIVGHGMLDRYPELKVGFLEFGGEWLLYMMGRMEHYLANWRGRMPGEGRLPKKRIEDYVKSGKIFLAPEAEDKLLLQEMEAVGEDQILFSSDFPHGEGRENAAQELLERTDLTDLQKRKLLYDNTARFFGAA